MKKLMIIMAVAMAAFASQAATASWKVSGGNIFDSTGTATKYAGTAYMFDAGTITMANLFAAYEANSSYDFAANAAGTLTIANGAVATTGNTFAYGESGNNYSFYMVIVDNGNIYFSNQKDNLAALNPRRSEALLLHRKTTVQPPSQELLLQVQGSKELVIGLPFRSRPLVFSCSSASRVSHSAAVVRNSISA